eukprot:XP_011676636.1 PREDICTED: uncharacterized protein LOC105444296 [Strongylocentrotus purpuratus]
MASDSKGAQQIVHAGTDSQMRFRFRIQVQARISRACLGVYGDVPDDVVYTDLHRTVHKGHSVVLTCRFRGAPLAVYWKKGADPRTAPNLVSWIPTDDVTGLCKGVRPCQIMEMNEDHSLVIKEVSIAEQGRYICRVSSYRGILIHNFTDISVFSPPMEPFPVINECQMISPNITKTTCTISTNHSVVISCTASGYFPDIDLYFLNGSISLHTKDTTEVTNVDGTKNKTIYAIATASEISYVCIASDIPGSQGQRTTTVLVNLPETTSPIPTGSTILTVTRHRYETNPTTVALIDKTDGNVAKMFDWRTGRRYRAPETKRAMEGGQWEYGEVSRGKQRREVGERYLEVVGALGGCQGRFEERPDH